MDTSHSGPQIGEIRPQDQDAALELVFDHLAPADRRRQIDEALAAQRSGAALCGLIGAWRGGRLVGAAFSQVQAGKMAILWPPRYAPGEPESTAASLLAASWEFLASRQVALALVLLETASEAEETLLRQGGFDRLADLLYLVSLKVELPRVAPVRQLDFEPYRETDHDRLVRIVEATYEATFDCPRLDGVRSTEDVLAGYRATGQFDPARWLIVRHAQSDVGCVLLADHPQYDHMELLYMGLMRAARGHGWGMQLARHAQWLAGRAGRARLVLAVDSANTPALRTYTAVGFQAWQQRRLYVRRLGV